MVKQYIRKRRFTKDTLFLSLISVYVWFIYEMISIIENDRGGRHLFYFWIFIMGLSLIMDIKCYCENRNYEVNFEKLEKTYYISSICSFVLKMILLLLFLICCISYQMIENKYLFLMMFAETLPIFISIILFLCDKVLGIKTERIEYKFEKNSLL